MSAQTYVIYDKYNGHIVCDIKDNYRIFDNAVKAEQYIRDKNLNQIDFVVERRDKFDCYGISKSRILFGQGNQ